MSSIHKALEKAQNERDFQHRQYDGVLSKQKVRRSFSGRPVLLGALVTVMVLSALVFYIRFGHRNTQNADREMVPKTEQASGRVTRDQGHAALPKNSGVNRERRRPTGVSAPLEKDRATITAPADIKQMYDRARAFQKIGRLNHAKRLYQELLNTNPDFVDALNNLGVIWMHEKNYTAARENFEKAVRLEPKNVDPQYNLACVCAMTGKKSLGILHLKKACLLDQAARKWARADNDLANLRQMPEVEEIIKQESE